MTDQNNTAQSFFDKWEKNPTLHFETTCKEGSDINSWIVQRNGFTSLQGFGDFLRTKRRILDAGCGNGRVIKLFRSLCNTPVVGVDLVAAAIAKENFAHDPLVSIFPHDLTQPLTEFGTFDFIYCQEVLHHTQDPRRSFKNLVTVLEPGGDIAIYVYQKKAPIREFSDDLVRGAIAPLSYEEALAESSKIADLGKTLQGLKATLTVPTITSLGIEGGTYDLQRFIYHFFLKCFWNDELTPHANALVNYDWFHPQLCFRYTPEEIEDWYKEEGLDIRHLCVDHYGITIRGRKVG